MDENEKLYIDNFIELLQQSRAKHGNLPMYRYEEDEIESLEKGDIFLGHHRAATGWPECIIIEI